MKAIGQGVYADDDGAFWIRPTINGGRTWRKLAAIKRREAMAEGAAMLSDQKRAAFGLAKDPFRATTGETVDALISDYLAARAPNRKLEPRSPAFVAAEAGRLKWIREWAGRMPPADLRVSHCHEYRQWRLRRITKGTGDRTVEMELVSLSNVLSYGVARGFLDVNLLKHGRPRYRTQDTIRHCRDVAVASGDELHVLADALFADPRSEVLGWQLLFEAMTGCRTVEILRLRMDATTRDVPGFVDGNYLFLARAKRGVHPWALIHRDLQEVLDCHRAWHRERFPDCPWYFPGKSGIACVTKNALTQRLRHLCIEVGLPHRTSHGLRSFYVTARRSMGVSDTQIAAEIGDKTVDLIATTYGDLPPNWSGGTVMSWRPTGKPPSWQRWADPENKVIPFAAVQ